MTVTWGQFDDRWSVETLIRTLNANAPLSGRGVYDVFRYGGVGDGIADDTLAIQAAVNAAAIDGRAVVQLPPGEFRVSRQGTTSGSAAGGYAVRMASGVSIRGSGYQTVIRNTGMVGGTSPTDNGTWYSAFECADGTHDVVVKHLRFKGDNSPFQDETVWYQRQMDCVGVRGTTCRDITVRNCWFEDQLGFSVHNEGTGLRINVLDCDLKRNANGLNVNADHTTQARNWLEDAESIECSGKYAQILGNRIIRPTEAGISYGGNTAPGSVIPGGVIAGNVVADSTGTGITVTDAVDGALIQGNASYRSTRSGIMLVYGGFNLIRRCRVSGNMLIDCGHSPSGVADRSGIHVQCNIDGVVEDNTVDYGVTAGYDTGYGILVIGALSTGLRIARNRLRSSFKAIENQSPGVYLADDNILDWSTVSLVGAGSWAGQARRDGVVVVPFPGGSANVNLNPALGSIQRVSATDAGAFTIMPSATPSTPAGGLGGTQSERLTVVVFNGTGGAMGAVTFYAGAGGFRTTGAFTSPATGKARSISFYWDATLGLWVETARTTADV